MHPTHSSMRRSSLVLLMTALTFAVLCSFATASAWAATQTSTQVEVPVHQEFITDTAGVADSFDYVLTVKTEGAPLPQSTSGKTYTLTMQGTDDAVLSFDFSSTKVGTYTYTLAANSASREGYAYESRTYTIAAYVKEGQEGSITCETFVKRDSDGMKVARIDLDPTYTAPANPPPLAQPRKRDRWSKPAIRQAFYL